jgi:cobalt-precorrin 5A hydrolase/precorrin-3B C17-methyltransferase
MAVRLSQVQGFVAEGDVIGVDWAISEGRFPFIFNTTSWPTPRILEAGLGPELVTVTDQLQPIDAGMAFLRPPSLVVGVHPCPSATSDALHEALIDVLADLGLARSSVAVIATNDASRNDKAVRRLGLPVRSFDPARLDRVPVSQPNRSLRSIVGTRSVCEAAAMLAAGRGATLLAGRMRTPMGTISIVRRKPARDVIIDVPRMSSGQPVHWSG